MPAGTDVTMLDTDAGARQLETGFTAAFGGTRPATRVRHLSTLRSACTWWCGAGDPTATWARPKVPVDSTRALTREQVDRLWRLNVGLRDKTRFHSDTRSYRTHHRRTKRPSRTGRAGIKAL